MNELDALAQNTVQTMSDELDQAQVLWRRSEAYVNLAREHFYLEQKIEQLARMATRVAEIIKPTAGLTLPPGYGMEHQTRVHFLFPNLEPKERAVLSLILLWSDPVGGKQPSHVHKQRLAKLEEQFHELEIVKKVTPVQKVIIETKILRTS